MPEGELETKTEDAQFWLNQELITSPPMVCAVHKNRTDDQRVALAGFSYMNTLLEKMYHTVSTTEKRL